MKRIFNIAVLAALSLLLVVPMVLAQSAQVVQTIEEVEDETEEIRGLTELEPIDVRFMTNAELEQKLIEELTEDYTPEEWARDESLLKLLGFLEENDDYYDIMLGLYTEQIAGFYDPEEKYLALISGEETLSAYDRLTLSHEITHALQDQYYHLDKPPYDNPDSTDYDADFAASCLVEGDATLTMTLYQETFTSEDYAEILEEYGDVETTQFDNAPQYIQNSLLFPYTQGETFVSKLFKRGEFEAVDAAYSDPPTSTEQVLHPEKYFAREMPVPVECPEITSSLGEGWTLADTNVLGEFDIDELLMTELSETDADDGAEGWGGCQYRFYSNAGSGENLLVIDLKWDTPEEAEEFAGLFGEYVENRYGQEEGSYELDGGWAVWDAEKQGSAAISLEDDETLVVLATDNSSTAAAVGALGTGGEKLAEILEQQPDLGGKRESGSSGINWTAMGIIIAFLALILILFLVVLLISRRERVAQELYPPYLPQQPEWPQGRPQAPGPYQGPYQPPMPPQQVQPTQPPDLPPTVGDA